ncbi:hypothetical protein MD484_g3948, partial [Candolleomyces efflorescens]
MPRAQKPSSKPRHDPLHVQLDEDEAQAKYGRISQPGKRTKSRRRSSEDGNAAEVTLDPKTSRRVFELAKEQQDELEMPDDSDEDEAPRPNRHQPRPTHASDEDDDDNEDLDYTGVADIEYEEEFVGVFPTLPSKYR